MKHIIFDMDGVLVDTHNLHSRALIEAVRELGFGEIPAEILRSSKSSRSKLISVGVTDESVLTEILAKKTRLYPGIVRQHVVPIGNSLTMLLRDLSTICKLGICSNSNLNNLYATMEAAGISTTHFQAIIGGDTVEPGRQKPEPDLYVKACNWMGIRPHEAIVFEDSQDGCMAALKAGCYVRLTKCSTILRDLQCVY